MNRKHVVVHAIMIACMLQLSACQSADRPAELFDTQRNLLKPANQLQEQLQRQLDTRMQGSDDTQR
jgi:hypothetical protein